MPNKILNLIFKADASDATKELAKLKGEPGTEGVGGSGVMGVTSAIKGLITPALVFAGAMYASSRIISDEISNWSDFISEVAVLGDMFNMTNEDASQVFATMERGNITQDTMVAVFRRLIANGLEPTIENVRDLLIEYDNITDKTEQAQFATENFGEQGLKQVISYYNSLTEAEKESFMALEDLIVVTEDQIQMNKELQLSVLEATNKWRIFKFELLEGVIPALISVLDWMNKVAEGGGPSQVERWQAAASYGAPTQPGRWQRRAAGGSFTVGGSGGSDTTPVGFMATPGETVTVGGGTGDMQNILSEVRRLVDSLPVAISDAVERR